MPSSIYPATLPQTVWTTVASAEVRSSEASVFLQVFWQQPKVAKAVIVINNRALLFMCLEIFGYYFTNIVVLSLRGLSMRIFGFRYRSIYI